MMMPLWQSSSSAARALGRRVIGRRLLSAGVVSVPLEEVRQTTARALQNLGWDESDAALQAEIMTAAEMCGNNQVRFACLYRCSPGEYFYF
jgi:hypothetical protein